MFNNKSLLYIMATAVATVLLSVSCRQEKQQHDDYATKVDSILFDLGKAQDYHRLLALTDSFEQKGELSEIDANRWRGVGYNYLGQLRNAEFYYKKVMEADIKTNKDKNIYFKSARRLAEILVKRSEYEDGLRVSMETVSNMENWGGYTTKDHAIMLKTIGCCQINLGREREAATNYETAYRDYLQLLEGNDTIRQLNDAVLGAEDIMHDYINTHHFSEALLWLERLDTLMNWRIRIAPNYDTNLIDEHLARININRATVLQGLGQKREAAQAYNAAMTSDFCKTEEGKILAADYLVAAGRYTEAADNYAHMESFLRQHGYELTLDIIQNYVLHKVRANIGANRQDSITAMSAFLCNALDSAVLKAKTSDAAELATIYDTQGKEAQIARQKADLSRQRLFGISAASMLILIFLGIYIYHRIKAQRRLAAAYQQLEVANAQLEKANTQLEKANTQLEQNNEQLTLANARAEESSRMKTNFIQQISHEIRTPLNILSGFAQILTTPDMELDEDTWQDINQQIVENTERITGLVNKMLELSDANSRSVIERNDQVPAIQIAAEAVEASGIANAKHLTFDLQVSPDAETAILQTNHQAAVRALTLVLDNARKFTDTPEAYHRKTASDTEGKTALLSISSLSPFGGEDQEGAPLSTPFLYFTIEDNGPGIPLADADRIFDEFVQLNDYYDGTGIGLTVARSLARRLGGDITLDTTYTAGARFVMTLPQ